MNGARLSKQRIGFISPENRPLTLILRDAVMGCPVAVSSVRRAEKSARNLFRRYDASRLHGTSDVRPNISGKFQLLAGSAGASTGSFTDVGTDSRKSTDMVSGRTPTEKQFDASLSSSVYGGSEIVQPAALSVLACIKT